LPPTGVAAAEEDIPPASAPELIEERVPSSSFSRAFHFGMLGASVLSSGMGEAARRRVTGLFGGSAAANADPGARSAFVNERNAEQVARTLVKLRGAALKVGQLLSLQDEGAMPAHMQAVFAKVRASANIMPAAQLHATLEQQLGEGWRSRVRSFNETPLAAASIGQVHRVVLPDGRLCALKVQYPGVAESVDSDLSNLRRLATYTGALPKTLFVDNIIAAAREELLAECDYVAEAAHTQRYGSLLRAAHDDPLLGGGKLLTPEVIPELSSERVLTTELMHGSPIEAVAKMSMGRRNAVASRVLLLTLRELFHWRFVQTDPNWGNYLYDAKSDALSLIDFGAAIEYGKPFVDKYMRMVEACARRDRGAVLDASIDLGFLTGDECKEMMDAHVAAAFVLGEPFGSDEPYDFAASQLSARVREHVPTMMRHRLCPPPSEIYSLHRKLSGAYMLCIRLGATIDCREAFDAVHEGYAYGPVPETPGATPAAAQGKPRSASASSPALA
jgi:aarF domain-containing kinase